MKSKLNERNKITAINAWASALFRYGTGIVQWKKNELKDAGKKINKNNDNVWGIKLEEWCGEIVHKEARGRQSAESCVREEEKGVSCYVFSSEKNFIRRVAAAETINTEDTVTSKKIRKQEAQELKQN